MLCFNKGGGHGYTVGKRNGIILSGKDTGIKFQHHRVIIYNKYFRGHSPLYAYTETLTKWGGVNAFDEKRALARFLCEIRAFW